MTRVPLFVLLLAMVTLAACRRESPTPASNAPSGATTTAAPASTATAVVPLKDVVETTPRYVIGITYPKEAAPYPGLVSALMAYAASARKDLIGAVEALGNDTPTAPYELSLSYTTLVDSPTLVAIAADGSLYTGGAHGSPLIARFVWLPQAQRDAHRRRPGARCARAGRRSPISCASNCTPRCRNASMPTTCRAEERADMLKNAGEMIDDGTEPKAAAFSQFEPRRRRRRPASAALRFVFPPYQVGPYADGTQTVEVPAEVLLPHVAPAYRSLVPRRLSRRGSPARTAMSPHPFRQRVEGLFARRGPVPRRRARRRRRALGPARARRALLPPRARAGLARPGRVLHGRLVGRDALDGMLFRLLAPHRRTRARRRRGLGRAARALDEPAERGARFEVGERHYDLGNDLYRAMLGKRLVYSCGYWREADDLDDAQEAKLDLVCRKLGLRPGMRVLDIGCGWGEALKFAAERYGVQRRRRHRLARTGRLRARAVRGPADRDPPAGLPRTRCDDSASTASSRSACSSTSACGTTPRTSTSRAAACDRRAGRRAVPAAHHRRNVSVDHTDPWIARYIFPNSMLPSAAQIAAALRRAAS